jgi:hypothetical protein
MHIYVMRKKLKVLVSSTSKKCKQRYGVGVVLGFSTVYFCRLMPTFWRNILSPSSGLSGKAGKQNAYVKLKEGRLRERGQPESKHM